jgi:hypothetical protein
MINYRSIFLRIVAVAMIVIISGFGNARKRKFEVMFNLKNIQSFAPSDQMAIWLEKPDSSYVKTLFLSEYLSYGGFRVDGICNDWSSKASWENVSVEEFDAVTAATPSAGEVKLKLECPAGIVPDGQYIILLEVHLVDQYNELYSGTLNLGGKKTECSMEVSYRPEPCAKKTEGDILSDVRAAAK